MWSEGLESKEAKKHIRSVDSLLTLLLVVKRILQEDCWRSGATGLHHQRRPPLEIRQDQQSCYA